MDRPEGPRESASEPSLRRERWHRWRRRLEPVLVVILFFLALAALRRELQGHGLREIGRTLRALPATSLAAAVGLTLLSYLALTLHDALGVRYARRPSPWRTAAPASFVSHALSHNVGIAALIGGGVRGVLAR